MTKYTAIPSWVFTNSINSNFTESDLHQGRAKTRPIRIGEGSILINYGGCPATKVEVFNEIVLPPKDTVQLDIKRCGQFNTRFFQAINKLRLK